MIILLFTEPSTTTNPIIPVLIAAIVTILTAIVTWSLNERSKRKQEIYIRKEQKYIKLIENLKGFYADSNNSGLKNEFLMQLNLCWLYCPDIIIKKAYSFLEKVETGQKTNDREKEKAVGELILEIRKDLIKNERFKSTSLTPNDFKHLTSN